MARVVIKEAGAGRVFQLDQLTEDITTQDLLEATGADLRAWDEVWVDGHQVSLDTLVNDVPGLEGSLFTNQSGPLIGVDSWRVLVVGGMDTGEALELKPGATVRMGRSPEADITVESLSASWSHCALTLENDEVRVVDDESSNGTFVDGVRITDPAGVIAADGAIVSAGGASLLVLHGLGEDVAPRPGRAGNITSALTVPFNRPPRLSLPARPDPVEVPLKKDPQKPGKFSWVAVAAPLLMAVVLVAVMGSARYALIALLSPVMAVGSWWEQKRRAKSSEKEEEENYAVALAEFAVQVQEMAEKDRDYRRARLPDAATCHSRVLLPSTRLWQRRKEDDDYWAAHLGVASVPFDVPLDSSSTRGKHEERLTAFLKDATIPAAPVEVDFAGGPVGIWGERDECLAIARSLLCQLSTHNGPADLSVGVFTDEARSDEWRWCAWLPHVRQPGSNPDNLWLGLTTDSSQRLLRALRDNVESLPTPSLVLVVDSHDLTEGRDSPARDILTHNRSAARPGSDKPRLDVSGIVIASTPEQLPAACRSVIHAKADASATLHLPSRASTLRDITIAGTTLDVASDWARGLARFDDPETKNLGATLPALTHLLPLLGLADLNAEAILELWDRDHGFSTPLGVSEDGTFGFDLVRDGPHGLVGGTTGSGKSELLRSLVAGLAARVDPEHLTFILIDFKGGAAFASCDQLPHTIGTISNLDAQLADRALRALEAEMLYRQHLFAESGENVDNLDAYLATNPSRPLPRLLLVVDEFAQLAKEYPDVLSSLVSIGAVGRTLGIHMILATQRPAGVVNDDILANTNLRVALRVQSREDSSNVISVPHASAIGRDQRGRAYVKLGEEDIQPIQTALVTGYCDSSTPDQLRVTEVEPGSPAPVLPPQTRAKSEANDLDRLIEAIRQANEVRGFDAPRRVWPEPLGDRTVLAIPGIHLDESDAELPAVEPLSGTVVRVAVSDDPDHQRQYPTGWDLADGNLLLMGIPGSGTTTTLTSLALSAAATSGPEELDVLILDLGSRELEPLTALPHVAAYAPGGASGRELQERLLRYLKAELDVRLSDPLQPRRRIIVLIDGLATLREEYDDYEAMALLESFYQAWGKGPDVGIHMAASTTRAKAVPSQIEEVTTQKWLFRLADPYDYAIAGIKRENIPPALAGRCVVSGTGHHTHVATTLLPLGEAVQAVSSAWTGAGPKLPVVAALPTQAVASGLDAISRVGTDPWLIPVGVRESDLCPAVLEVYEGEHILVSGPARSGKSTCLLAVAEKLVLDGQRTGVPVEVWGIAGRRSPLLQHCLLNQSASHADMAGLLALARVTHKPTVLLIDDAEQLDDTDQMLSTLIKTVNPHLVMIVAGRSDELRSQYGHWTAKIRKSRLGVLLQPNVDFDGELLGVSLPRRTPVQMSTARGYACQGGQRQLIQAITHMGERDGVGRG